MSIGIRVLALVVHGRPLLLTSGSVRWMIRMKERERLRFRGTDPNMMYSGLFLGEDRKTEGIKKKHPKVKGLNRPAMFLGLQKPNKRNEKKK